MFGHSWIILVLILLIVLIVIGPGKLGGIGGALGQSIREFRKTSAEPDPSKKASGDAPPGSTTGTDPTPKPPDR